MADKRHIMGVFSDEEPLVEAFDALKKEQVEIADIFTPFPVHHIVEHHGKKTRIITLSWFYGLLSAGAVLAFLYYTAVISWPLNYGGKPTNAFPSFLVVTIVLTILAVTILSLFTFSAGAQIWPNVDKPIYHDGATDDKFVILFEKEKIDEGRVRKLLADLGADEIIEK